MWRETYDSALRHHIATPDRGVSAAEKFLDDVLGADELSGVAIRETARRLVTIGRELAVPMAQLKADVDGKPRHEKLGFIQVQVVCRLFLCGDGSDALEAPVQHGELPPEPPVRRRSKSSKKAAKRVVPTLRSELRELLDRTALLLDSTSPPSIAESEDEPSPFHNFLLNVLQARLGNVLPHVFRVIREDYELDDNELIAVKVPVPRVTRAKRQLEQALDDTAILSALKDERPVHKRPRALVSDTFKQVQLPSQSSMAQDSSHRSSRERQPSSGKSRSTSEKRTTVPRSPQSARKAATAQPAPTLMSLAEASRKPKSLKPATSMPMLIRDVDRTSLPFRSPPSRQTGPMSTLKTTQTASRRPQQPTVRALSKESVVIRTPERPQRAKDRQSRILVVSSPPLRNPLGGIRRQSSAPRFPQ